MLSQTIDQLLPLLELMDQPAFCLRQDGTVICNRAAQSLAPASALALPTWLGNSAELYEQWDGRSALSLPVPLAGQTCSAAIQQLQDGTLFLLSQCDALMAGADSMAVAAQVLRQPLTELCSLTQTLAEEMEDLEDPMLQEQSCAVTRQIYRLTRIACNLADMGQLRSGTYTPRLEKLALSEFLPEMMEEIEDICRTAGREFSCQLPARPMVVCADPMLLERALLNLISNALKYGAADKPVSFRVDASSTALMFRVRSTCSQKDCDLLSSAFQRLSQRGVLPDPQWGIGLGLPMTRYIAQLMGGTVAVDVSPDQVATVTMSISRKRNLAEVETHILPPIDYAGGMRHSLVELSDCLPDSCFDSLAL